jgi:hypothetical protein
MHGDELARLEAGQHHLQVPGLGQRDGREAFGATTGARLG